MLLTDVMDINGPRLAHHLQELSLPLLLELHLQRRCRIEVILNGPLRMAADDQDLLNPACQRLFNNVLDCRLVHNRQHLFWRRLRRRQKSRTKTSCRNDCLANLLHHISPYIISYIYLSNQLLDIKNNLTKAPSATIKIHK